MLYGDIAAFLLGCTLVGATLFWTPLSDGEWTFLLWAGVCAMVADTACMVVAVFLFGQAVYRRN